MRDFATLSWAAVFNPAVALALRLMGTTHGLPLAMYCLAAIGAALVFRIWVDPRQ